MGRWPVLKEGQLRRIVSAGDMSPAVLARELGLDRDHVRWLQYKLGVRLRPSEWGTLTKAHADRLKAWQAELDAVEAFVPEIEL